MSSVFAILLFAATMFGEEGTASGKLTVGGKTTLLTHAYALARKDTFDKTKERVLVILSDAAIPQDTLWDQFPGLKMAMAGQLHAVEVEIDANKSVTAALVVHEAFVDTYSLSGSPYPDFEAKKFGGPLVEGKLSSGKPQQLQNKKFEYAATFRAPLLHRPAPTATGAAAAQSAPGKVVLAFLKAIGSGDKAGIRKLLTAEYGKPLDGPNAKAILEAWKNRIDPAAAPIDAVYITGNSAEVVMTEKATGEVSGRFALSLVGGQWKIEAWDDVDPLLLSHIGHCCPN